MDQIPSWEELVSYARYSPSPHNVQPWKVKILSPTTAEILYDPKRLLYVEDDTGCFTITTFGLFIEYLSIAASPYGYTIETTYTNTLLDEKKTSLTHFADIKLVKTNKKVEFDRELIKKRKTSRLPYTGKPVPDSVVTELQHIAKTYGHTFTFSTAHDLISWLLRLNRDTIFYDMEDTKTREEIGSWLRYTKNAAYKKQDGLWAYCMTIPGILLYLFFHFRKLFNLPGISTFARQYYLQSTRGTRTIGWLTGPFTTPTDWIHAGHMLGRLWLCMTKHQVYLHPFGSIITNKNAHQRLAEKFSIDESKEKTWLLMRLGYSSIPPRSLRIPLADIIVST